MAVSDLKESPMRHGRGPAGHSRWFLAAKFSLVTAVLCAALLIGKPCAKAEDCGSLGCKGRVGYLFIPTHFFELTKPSIFSGGAGINCSPETDSNPFGGMLLPAINSIQTVKEKTVFFEEAEIQQTLDRFQPEHVEKGNTEKSCRVVWSQPGPDGEIGDISVGIGVREGVGVRILGYRTFVSHYSVKGTVRTNTYERQLLFAMVLITKDGA